jgi:alkaline phosphatase
MTETTTAMDRRRFLGIGGAVVGGVAISDTAHGALPASPRRRSKPLARNVIFMVSDGMSFGTLTLADMLIQQREQRSSSWVSLWDRPGVRRASMKTFSANALVTDSAAAGSAWGGGVHVNNGVINHTPDGQDLTPILVQARHNGKATGLVTTTRVTHATPATFIANVPKRSQENEIARQILDRGVDVTLGGGARHFPKALLEKYPDVRVVRNRDELDRAGQDGSRLLGIFADSHMHHELDRDPAKEPSLAEMTAAALARLSACSDGFVMQIEGGRVDHGAHANDVGALLYDQVAFDEAVALAAAFVAERDDTLLIVTTDHGNANPGLTFYGQEGIEKFKRIGGISRSFEWILREAGKAGAEREGALPGIIERATGVTLDTDELEILHRAYGRERVDPFKPANAPGLVLGSLLANHLGVAFLSPNHTSDFVELTAIGPGADQLPPMIDNVDVHPWLVGVLDLSPV